MFFQIFYNRVYLIKFEKNECNVLSSSIVMPHFSKILSSFASLSHSNVFCRRSVTTIFQLVFKKGKANFD